MTEKALAVGYQNGSGEVFTQRPIRIGGFELTTRAAIPIGKPNLEEWAAVMRFANAAAESSPYWCGDLMRYADSRTDWATRLEQVMEITGLARQTIINYTSICKRVEEPERQLAPSIGHADVVAKLAPAEQRKWLKRATSENLTPRELRLKVGRASREKVLEGQAETMHDVDVTITLSLEAADGFAAEQLAWKAVAASLKASPPATAGKARVIAAHAKS